jgi:hypothetical protein
MECAMRRGGEECRNKGGWEAGSSREGRDQRVGRRRERKRVERATLINEQRQGSRSPFCSKGEFLFSLTQE